MQLQYTTIAHCPPKPAGEGGRALNKAYRKEKVLREDLDNFKAQLRTLLGRLNTDESEENAKNHLRDFLNDTGYKGQTISKIAEYLDLSTRAVEKQIAKLKQEKRIRRVGPSKGGYWEVSGE